MVSLCLDKAVLAHDPWRDEWTALLRYGLSAVSAVFLWTCFESVPVDVGCDAQFVCIFSWFAEPHFFCEVYDGPIHMVVGNWQ